MVPLQGGELTCYFVVTDGQDRLPGERHRLRLMKYAVGLGDSSPGRGQGRVDVGHNACVVRAIGKKGDVHLILCCAHPAFGLCERTPS
jgi:hypothetical protein